MDPKNVRKACDLCYRKRIKCDGQTPRCSNCQVYSCECTHDAASRPRKKKKKARASASLSGQEQPKTPQSNTTDDGQTQQQQVGPIVPQQAIEEAQSGSSVAELSHSILPPFTSEQGDSDLIDPLLLSEANDRVMELPSENIVRHVIDVYLATFNNTLPLFHSQSLYRTVDDWYHQPLERRQSSSWAAINIALALALCHGYESLNPAVARIMTVTECLDNAQSVLSDILAAEDIDLQNLQILLGLGTLFLGARPDDVRAPMIYVSTAMRLAQAMGMHRRDWYEGLAPIEAMQRRRVFWIAYILDRDVAARMRQAPIINDADLDLDLPPDYATLATGLYDDDAGFIDVTDRETQETGTRFNIFRARVELAQIQGRVYDCNFSVRSKYMEPGESARLAQSIRMSIQQWKARLPAALRVDALTSPDRTSMMYLPAAMCYMQSLVILCLGQLCRVNSMDFTWIDKVLSYARGVGDGTTVSGPSSTSASLSAPPPPQPQGWNVLITECRTFVRLFQSIQVKHPTFVNVQLCPFASALLCMSINTFLNFEDSNRVSDQCLMTGAAEFLGQVTEEKYLRTISKVLNIHAELDWHLILLTTELVA